MAEDAQRSAQRAAGWFRFGTSAVLALAGLELLWEWQLAPLRPGGSWLVLKALPASLAFVVLLRGGRRARFATALLLLLYFAEGVVRAASEHGRASLVAGTAAVIALGAFTALFLGARIERRARLPEAP